MAQGASWVSKHRVRRGAPGRENPTPLAYVTPLTRDGRLSARDFLGGPAKLRKMQTDFHHWCGKPFGLSRGVEGAKARHQKVPRYYQALATPERIITRTDLAAAVVGIHTQSYATLLARAQASATQFKLQSASEEALQDRHAAPQSQRIQLERFQLELEDREIVLEKGLDQLEKVNHELEMARLTANQEKERADRLAKKLTHILRRVSNGNTPPLPH
ncbi:plasmid recombination protein [Pseudomonas marginalis]|uniref:plasmid recombination protein n=1 Tax=Pseudomonas marginalis TaxID=298 RepID=UPI000AA44DB6|nr:plasmid recombination protein [Pseudomonas marginalis]